MSLTPRCWHCRAPYVGFMDCCLYCSRPRVQPRAPLDDELDPWKRNGANNAGPTIPGHLPVGKLCLDCNKPTHSQRLRCDDCWDEHDRKRQCDYDARRAGRTRERVAS